MIWDLLIALTVIFAATGLVLVTLVPILRDRPAPAVRTPFDIPPGWTRNERGALVPPVPHSPQKRAPKHAKGSIPVQTVRERTVKPPREPGSPWDTAAQPVLTDEETLNLYKRGEQVKRGNWGTMHGERVIAAELPQVIA